MNRLFPVFLIITTVLVLATLSMAASISRGSNAKANSLARKRYVRAVNSINARLLNERHQIPALSSSLPILAHQGGHKKKASKNSRGTVSGVRTANNRAPNPMKKKVVSKIKSAVQKSQQRKMKTRIQLTPARVARAPPAVNRDSSQVTRQEQAQRWLGTMLNV